ncbi:hypothetical protein [Acetilactobacillus jinshanensis]|uniref:Uncharacterized protein n=1 Tax=Acetilactobacillus jinshanensis TaxID=1720083 RepID=A0A4P6ZM49_9LACO|nr:hypothetical protein [Acetilactobacillus jinshanensis]QBP18683.1 hypothetical protein ELX58_05980 [Acetilactobacillus jinshanensis]URL61559.1 hypothetical protein HGK75_06120 [uncultured bacterium]
MKKLTKFSLILLGLSIGITLLSTHQINRLYNDHIENQILKKIQSRYQGFNIKGTWIQKHGNHYIGGITVQENHQWLQHRFEADQNGQLILDN